MKNIILTLLAISTLGLAGLYINARHQAINAEAELRTVKANVGELTERLEQQESKAVHLQTRLQDTRAKAVEKADEVTSLQQALTNSTERKPQAGNKFGEAISNMMTNEGMKDYVKSQQKQVLGGMLEKSYGAFMTQMQLTPEQSGVLKELLMKRMLTDAELGMSMMGGGMEEDKRTALMDKVKAEKDGINGDIKQYLGESNYKELEAYEKTVPERMALSMFKDQLGTGAGALTPEQESQLVGVMGEERQSNKFTTDYSDQSKLTGDMSSYFTDEKIAQFEKETEALHEKYIARSETILTPEQQAAFTKYLKTQREMQKMGMKMAAGMFGGSGAPPIPTK
jgi:hypothetical protein